MSHQELVRCKTWPFDAPRKSNEAEKYYAEDHRQRERVIFSKARSEHTVTCCVHTRERICRCNHKALETFKLTVNIKEKLNVELCRHAHSVIHQQGPPAPVSPVSCKLVQSDFLESKSFLAL